jgi:hypothetical protein
MLVRSLDTSRCFRAYGCCCADQASSCDRAEGVHGWHTLCRRLVTFLIRGSTSVAVGASPPLSARLFAVHHQSFCPMPGGSVQRRRIAIATVLTLVAGAAAAVLSFSLGVFASNDSVSDKPRPPMIILTRSPNVDDEGGE